MLSYMQNTVPIIVNQNIQFDISDNSNHRVVSQQDIKAGELLLLEKLASHCNRYTMISFIISNKDLFNNLYPRITPSTNNIEELAVTKFQKNVFHIDNSYLLNKNIEKLKKIKISLEQPNADIIILEKEYRCVVKSINNYDIESYALGFYISKFNHASRPNIDIHFITYNKNNIFVCAISNQDISKGTELNIYYRDNCVFGNADCSDSPYCNTTILPTEVHGLCKKHIYK